MNELKVFEGKEVEVLNIDGVAYFNPYHVGECLELTDSAVRMAIKNMNERQVVKLTNSIVKDIDFRKLNNAGENFLTESGVYKLVFRSNKPNAEKFTDWVTDEVLPSIRKTGQYGEKKEQTNPWFIKWYKGKPIITVHDFNKLIGFDIKKSKKFFRPEYFIGGLDWNGLGQGPLREEFERINNVHYEEETFWYLHPSGVAKALRILNDEGSINLNDYKAILYSLSLAEKRLKINAPKKKVKELNKPVKKLPLEINIVFNGDTKIVI